MTIIKAQQGDTYEAANHFDCWCMKKYGVKDGSKRLNISVSEFLPSGGASMTASDKERCYFVLRGSVTVQSEQGEEFVLNENDMIYIAPGEKRALKVNGSVSARILVVIVEV